MFSRIKFLLASIIIFHGHIYASEANSATVTAIGKYSFNPEKSPVTLALNIKLTQGLLWDDIRKIISNKLSSSLDVHVKDVAINMLDSDMIESYSSGFKRKDIKGVRYVNLLKKDGIITEKDVVDIRRIVALVPITARIDIAYDELK